MSDEPLGLFFCRRGSRSVKRGGKDEVMYLQGETKR
jgi:hypothetical protein